MAKNRVQNGKRLTHDPGATVVSGQPFVIGTLLGIALVNGVSGTEMEFAIDEVYNIPKLDAAVIAVGDAVDFDSSAGVDGEIDDNGMTPASGDLQNCGVAWETKGATTGESIAVKLNAAGLAIFTP